MNSVLDSPRPGVTDHPWTVQYASDDPIDNLDLLGEESLGEVNSEAAKACVTGGAIGLVDGPEGAAAGCVAGEAINFVAYGISQAS